MKKWFSKLLFWRKWSRPVELSPCDFQAPPLPPLTVHQLLGHAIEGAFPPIEPDPRLPDLPLAYPPPAKMTAGPTPADNDESSRVVLAAMEGIPVKVPEIERIKKEQKLSCPAASQDVFGVEAKFKAPPLMGAGAIPEYEGEELTPQASA